MASIGELLAKNLERLRRSKKLTQQELADLIDSTRQSIARYESGKGGATLDTIASLAKALDVEEHELVAGESIISPVVATTNYDALLEMAVSFKEFRKEFDLSRDPIYESLIHKLSHLEDSRRKSLLKSFEMQVDSFLEDEETEEDSDTG